MLILLLIKFYLISFDSLCLTKDLKEVINETEDKLNSDFNPTSERLSQNQKIFNIGAVLSSEESIGHFLQVRRFGPVFSYSEQYPSFKIITKPNS